MRGNLAARQEEMRRRMQAQQQPKCANPECTHQPRKGQAYCSRCTTKAIQEKLRDTLPGLKSVSPQQPKTETTGDGKELAEQEQNKAKVEQVIAAPKGTPSLRNEPSPVAKEYSRKQAAKIIGVSQTTLIKWERKGVCSPRHIAFGNKYIYSEEEIEKARAYRNAELPLNYAPQSTGERAPRAGTLDSFAKQRGAKFTLGKKVEKSVAKQLGSIGGRLV